jgi:uncharacterized protein
VYEFSIAVFRHSLRNLAGLLHKSAAFAEQQRILPEVLLEMRLAPDMFSLGQQVRAVSYHALAAAANLIGEAPPEFEGGARSLPELLAEIDATVAWLDAIEVSRLQGSAGRQVTLELRRGRVRFDGRHYLAHFALPNFFFHLTTAYDILRHLGVPVGKADFLGDLSGFTRPGVIAPA